MAAARAIPATAAARTPAVMPASAPMPMATIDSPRAMITINPCRSAKWPGTSRQPSAPNSSGPAMSRARASAHSAPCQAPSAAEAAASRPTPTAVLPPRPTSTERRRRASSRLATQNRPMCATRTTP